MSNFSELSDGQKVARVFKYIGLSILGLIVFFGSWTIVGPGEQGVKVTLGKVSNETLGQGLHFKLPLFTGVTKISVKTQSIVHDKSEQNQLTAASSDLQDVGISVTVNYRLEASRVMDVFTQYRSTKEFASSVLAPIVRDTVKANSAKFTAEELIKKRAEFSSKVIADLNEKFQLKGAVAEQVNITDISFSDAFTKAIEAKVTAEQSAFAAQNKLKQVQFEADQRIAQAKGEAEAIKIQASAITQQGGADYVKLQWIKQWNGALPTTMLGDNTPLVNIK